MKRLEDIMMKNGFKVFIFTMAILFFAVLGVAKLHDGFDPENIYEKAESAHKVVEGNKNSVEEKKEEEKKEVEEKKEEIKESTGSKAESDKKEIEENKNVVKEVGILVLINRENYLPKDYKASDLVIPNVKFVSYAAKEKRHLREEAARALEKLFEAAKGENLNLHAVSGYRSYNTQKAIYEKNVASVGKVEADKYSAAPGTSEHQTGLAMDVSDGKLGLVEAFASTNEGKWLKENAHKYGFIIRYPKGKENITGYNYEPWHIRYVGIDVATEIKERDITLEEYFNK